MLYTTHIQFSNIIYRNLIQPDNISINNKSFKFGNIVPDLTMNFKITPHNFHCSSGFIIASINNLISNTDSIEDISSKSFALRLGIINHYIADFFCWPHNKNLVKKKFVKHFMYERTLDKISRRISCRKLKKYLVLNLQSFFGVSDISKIIFLTYDKYKVEKRSALTDILFAIKTCIIVDNLIIRECLRNIESRAA